MFSSRFRSWIIVGLLLSNLAVGIVSLYFLRSVNEHYAALFEHSIPVINSLRTLTRELNAVQHLARRVSEMGPANSTRQELLVQLDDASSAARTHARDISGADFFKDTKHATGIVNMSREYDVKIDQYLRLAAEQNPDLVIRFNNEVLRPAYDNLQLTLDDAAAYVEQQGNNLRSHYTHDTRFFGGLALAFAGWPVLAAVLGILVLALLVITLMVTVFTPELGWRNKRPIPPAA